jgi:hypothetical protein
MVDSSVKVIPAAVPDGAALGWQEDFDNRVCQARNRDVTAV